MGKIAVGILGITLSAIVVAGLSSSGYGFEARDQLNINTARVEELNEVPGLDMELARNIVAYRNAYGPFASVDDLLKVHGLDEKRLERARMYLTVESQTHLE